MLLPDLFAVVVSYNKVLPIWMPVKVPPMVTPPLVELRLTSSLTPTLPLYVCAPVVQTSELRFTGPLTDRLVKRAPELPTLELKPTVPVLVAVKANAPSTVLLIVRSPVALIVVSAAKVMAPRYVEAVALELNKAPLALTPVPLMVKASAVTRLKPPRSRAAPVSTTVPDAIVPNGLFVPLPALPNLIVPAEIVVRPLYELFPERTTVPEPDLVSAPVPEIAPVLNVAVPLASAVKVAALLSVMLPVKVELFAPVPPIVIVPLLPA